MSPEAVPDAQTVELPWGAWYGDSTHLLTMPATWQVERLAPEPLAAWSQERISEAIGAPTASPTLETLAAGKQSVCIVVDDLARPTKVADVLPHILSRLESAGIADDAISIVSATGTHGPLTTEQLSRKVGAELMSRYQVESHDAEGPLVATGVMLGKNELHINRTFFEADLKIAIGSVLPHSFAGFSGGAKLVLPGLADVVATARSHKFVQLGLRGGGDPNENRFRLEAEEVCRTLGLAFVVCVISNESRDVAGVVAGDLVGAHRTACRSSATAAATPTKEIFDCLICNAYPKDIDLIQAEGALVALKTAQTPIVQENGVLLITTAASEGLGRHGLFEPGGASYVPPRRKRHLRGRDLWLYAPNVSTVDARQLYWEGYPVFQESSTLVEALRDRYPSGAKVGVLPFAPMQQIQNRA